MNRRHFLTGLTSLLAAPAIVRAASLMAVKPLPLASIVYPTGLDKLMEFAAGRVYRFAAMSTNSDVEVIRVSATLGGEALPVRQISPTEWEAGPVAEWPRFIVSTGEIAPDAVSTMTVRARA